MFDTPVINVAIGLVFCFAAVSLAASTLTEALASLVKLRANTLVTGVQAMLNDPKFSGLAQRVYQHALVHPQGNGAMQSNSRWWTYSGPSYIRAENFATALTDVLSSVTGQFAPLQTGIDAIADPQLKLLLNGIHERANGDLVLFQKQIAGWFDTAMDRVSGTYKRQAQLICLLAGLGLAASMNVDATHVVSTLWANPELARALAVKAQAAQADKDVKDVKDDKYDVNKIMTKLQELPVGPERLQTCKPVTGSEDKWVKPLLCVGTTGVTGYNLLGWLITAVASVFGAPFWFDMLGKLVQLRGAGPKPEEPKKP
jgi:hypothetical protein